MIAVRQENNLRGAIRFWHTPNRGLASYPVRWDLATAREFVNTYRSEKSPLAVYFVRGWYQKKIWPKEAK